MLFYRYCIQLSRPESEFYRSSLLRLIKMIDMSTDEEIIKNKIANNEPYTTKYFNTEPEQSTTITSMKEVAGFE